MERSPLIPALASHAVNSQFSESSSLSRRGLTGNCVSLVRYMIGAGLFLAAATEFAVAGHTFYASDETVKVPGRYLEIYAVALGLIGCLAASCFCYMIPRGNWSRSLDDARDTVRDAVPQLEKLNESLAEKLKMAQLEVTRLDGLLANANRMMEEYGNKNRTLEEQNNAFNSNNQTLESKVLALNQENGRLSSSLSNIEQTRIALSDVVENQKKQLETYTETIRLITRKGIIAV